MTEQPLRFISKEMLREKIPNTYEAIVVAAREARRLNMRAKMFGDEGDKEKKTTIALMRLLNGEIDYEYKPAENEEAG